MSRFAGCRIAPRDKRSYTLKCSEYNLAPSGGAIGLAEELCAGAYFLLLFLFGYSCAVCPARVLLVKNTNNGGKAIR